MALNNYVLRSPSTVILADERDPWVSWQNHLDRTSQLRGGVDIVAAVGTPIYARTSGVMLHVPDDGSAGNSCRFQHDDNPGWRDVFSHLSRYVGYSGQHFNAGDIVAYTGNTGGVTQHLHWHLVDPNGNRQNPWDYFSGSDTAGGDSTPVIQEEDDMGYYYYYDSNIAVRFFSEGRGKSRAVSSAEWNAVRAMQRGAIPKLPVREHRVSQNWYNKINALGTY